MKSFWSLNGLAGTWPACQIFPSRTLAVQLPISRFSTSATLQARKGKGGPKKDKRIVLIRYFLNHPRTPRPLRFSRLRALRHWAIHRAWNLYKAKQRDREERDLERMYNSMRLACEELRQIGENGMPGGKDEGRLYRVAMEKRNIWQGAPIEYARIQTDWPSKSGWNHEWKRG
ncbi:hypothetical protein EJ06DRAFT_497001 [Trichodelitschia bisporula]|uniref:Large ribosomal subunit protein mL40 n=1 Tax=Trichodelitschia bisporula TaxID=703511 RepID=A0A6G1HRA1_9PEZI|nr:hypothetical protein EJ06DRAFT_497001 [Trichodelitschia bisporula]